MRFIRNVDAVVDIAAGLRISFSTCTDADHHAGPNTKIMRKAKMSFQSGQVKQVIRTYAVEIQTSDKKELEADQVTMKLRKAMGANCEMFFCVL